MKKTRIILGFVFGFALGACASTFPFPRYGLKIQDYEKCKGRLLAVDEDDDRNLSECNDGSPGGKCTVRFDSVNIAFEKSYQKCTVNLKECQENLGQFQ